MARTGRVRHDEKSLANVLEEFTRIRNDLESLVKTFRENQVPAVFVWHTPEVEQALKKLPEFIADCQKEAREHIIEKGSRYRADSGRRTPAEMDMEIAKVKKKAKRKPS